MVDSFQTRPTIDHRFPFFSLLLLRPCFLACVKVGCGCIYIKIRLLASACLSICVCRYLNLHCLCTMYQYEQDNGERNQQSGLIIVKNSFLLCSSERHEPVLGFHICLVIDNFESNFVQIFSRNIQMYSQSKREDYVAPIL